MAGIKERITGIFKRTPQEDPTSRKFASTMMAYDVLLIKAQELTLQGEKTVVLRDNSNGDTRFNLLLKSSEIIEDKNKPWGRAKQVYVTVTTNGEVAVEYSIAGGYLEKVEEKEGEKKLNLLQKIQIGLTNSVPIFDFGHYVDGRESVKQKSGLQMIYGS
ncbi:MAG: hypothetical protein M1268_03355 [Patescibacteria group bacterium]|nr:hypothetical protein [Patescibacteria group bacterium]